MIHKTSFSKMPSKRGFTLFLSFFLVAISAISFQACRKEAFTEQLSSSNVFKNPITSDAAKAWFQNQFGETKSISPSSISSSSDTLDGYYFDASYEITPLWSESKITAYLRTNPILLVPVKSIPFLDAKGHYYTLVFFRDTLNQLDARLQVYEATPEYAKNNPKFSVDNFTGFFYQIHLTGKVDKVYGIEQGKFTHRIQLKPKEKSRIGKIQTRGWCDGCFYDDPTAGIATKIRCWLCDAFAISNGGDSGIDPITSTNPFGLLGYGETPTIDIGYGENTSVGSTGSSNPLGTGGNSLGTEFDDSIFNDPAYQQKIKEDYVLLTLNPTGTEREFLANNRALFDQFYSFLLQQGDYLEKISTSKQHLKLLMENTAYLSANQQVAYTSTIIETLSKYTKAGFMAEEFADLYIDKVAFQEVNVFLNKYQFQGTSVRDIKSILPYLRNTSTHDAALNIIKKDEIIRFGSGDSDFYITDVEKELKCFTRSTNGEKLFKVSICSDQPISNSRETRSGSDAGHTFLILEETDKITGEIVRRTLGFYPDDWMSAALQKERPSQLGRNAPHPYDVSISSDLKESDFFGVINNVRILSKNKYDLGKFNCTTFAIDCVQNYGFDNLPRTQVQITSTHGNGLTPSNLAEDMRAIILKPWQTRETTTNTPMPNSGSCN